MIQKKRQHELLNPVTPVDTNITESKKQTNGITTKQENQKLNRLNSNNKSKKNNYKNSMLTGVKKKAVSRLNNPASRTKVTYCLNFMFDN